MNGTISLFGCAPEPLIHYLKALGVLRLIVEQDFDREARGAWAGDVFTLHTEKSKEDLIRFFLIDYEPTPIVAPWNGGSGFADGEDISGREAIRASNSDRFKNYRETIEHILAFAELPKVGHLIVNDLINELEEEIRDKEAKAERETKDSRELRELIEQTKQLHEQLGTQSNLLEMTIEQIKSAAENELSVSRRREIRGLLRVIEKLRTKVKKKGRSAGKDELVKVCRNRLNDRAVEWLDAVMLIGDEQSEAPILGKGGIDGHLEFTKNFMACLRETLPELINVGSKKTSGEKRIEQSKSQLRVALFGNERVEGMRFSPGQFNPGGVGGVNATSGVEAKDSEVVNNPWDLILTVEGTLLFAGAVVKRLAAGARRAASFPFYVKSVRLDEAIAPQEKNNGEFFLPIWERPATYEEIKQLFNEGRLQLSLRYAEDTLEAARAIARLGVDRGITRFQRYALLTRHGDAQFAVSLGSIEVRQQSALKQDFFTEIDGWIKKFREIANKKESPASLPALRQEVDRAIYRYCAERRSEDLRTVLTKLGEAEAVIALRPGLRGKDDGIKPLPALSYSWFKACNDEPRDDSDEFKIAAAVASINSRGWEETASDELGESDERAPFRCSLEPVLLKRKGRVGKNRFVFEWAKNNTSPSAVWSERHLTANLAAVLQRRSVDAQIATASHLAIEGAYYATLNSIAALLNDKLDERKIERLLRGLSLIGWRERKKDSDGIPPELPRLYALMKLLFLPRGELRFGKRTEPYIIKHEPRIVPLLVAQRVSEATQIAVQRLTSSGLVPRARSFNLPSGGGERLAAALLVPISQSSVSALAKLILRPVEDEPGL